MNKIESPFSRLFELWLEELIDAYTRKAKQQAKEDAAIEALNEVLDKAANQHYMKLVENDPATSFMLYVNKRFEEYFDGKQYQDFKMSEFLEKSELAKPIKEKFEDTDRLISSQKLKEEYEKFEKEVDKLSLDEVMVRKTALTELSKQVRLDQEKVAEFFSPNHTMTIETAPSELKELAKLFMDGDKLKQFEHDTDFIFSPETMKQNKEHPENVMDTLYRHRWSLLSEDNKLEVSREVKSIMFDEKTGRPRSILDIEEKDLLSRSPDAIYAAMKMQFVSSVVPSLMKEFDRSQGNILARAHRDFTVKAFGDTLSTKEVIKNPVMHSLKTNEETRESLKYKIPKAEDLKKAIDSIHIDDVNADKALEEVIIDKDKDVIELKELKTEEPVKTVARNVPRNKHAMPKRIKEEPVRRKHIPKHQPVVVETEFDKTLKRAMNRDLETAGNLYKSDQSSVYNFKDVSNRELEGVQQSIIEFYNNFKQEVDLSKGINEDNFYLFDEPEQVEQIIDEMPHDKLLAVLDKIEKVPEGLMREMTCINFAKDKIEEKTSDRERDEFVREKSDEE